VLKVYIAGRAFDGNGGRLTSPSPEEGTPGTAREVQDNRSVVEYKQV
jgi:hypothetical protein